MTFDEGKKDPAGVGSCDDILDVAKKESWRRSRAFVMVEGHKYLIRDTSDRLKQAWQP